MAFKRKWSVEVQRECVRRVLDGGDNARQACDAAREGRLQHRGRTLTATPDLPVGTVREWARIERVHRSTLAAASAGPESVLTTTTGELVALWQQQVTRAKRRASQNKVDARQLADLARTGIELERLTRAIGKGESRPVQTSRAKGENETPAGDDNSFVDELAAEPDA